MAKRSKPARKAALRSKTGKAKTGQWTPKKEKIFFGELALLCNVTAALKKAGMLRASRQVYDRRKRDPEFRAQWDEAIAESYAMLELEMLERGRFGADRPPPNGEAEARLRAVPTSLALSLLKLHQGRVKGRAPSAQRPMRGHKLRDELEARLSEISRRLGGIG
jgi:hypothetical protein